MRYCRKIAHSVAVEVQKQSNTPKTLFDFAKITIRVPNIPIPNFVKNPIKQGKKQNSGTGTIEMDIFD